MWQCEVRSWQQRQGKPYFVKLEDLMRKRGFRSVYAYDDPTVERILREGSAANLEGASVYSDRLFLDFDDVPCSDTLAMLYDEGIAHSVWNSGNRSIHVHIEIEPMVGSAVPYSQKRWVQRYIPDRADLTFYHHAGQYRLPWTLHEKTRRRKERLHSLPGRLLGIEYVERPIPRGPATVSANATGSFMARLLKAQHEPGRRVHAWHLAMSAWEEAVPYEEALKRIQWWNEHRCFPPLPPEVLADRVLQVYSKRDR